MGNIALNKPVTANKAILPYVAAKAVDGTAAPSNRWLTDLLPATLMVDPQAKYLVNRWVVKHPSVINSPAGWNNTNYANSDYKLQGSNDNLNWSDIDGVTNNSAASTDRTFTPIAFRYYRVYVSKGLRCNTQTTSILEVELYQAYSALLTALTISAGTLTPAFNPATLAYTATVNFDVATVNVTPTALSPMAVIKVNNVTTASGNPTPVTLNYGSNTITVNVTDGAVSQNYTIVVTRPGSVNLNALTMQAGAVNVPLDPAFNKATLTYRAKANYGVTTVTVTPTPEDPAAVVKVNGVLVPGGTPSAPIDISAGATIAAEVTATTGNKQTYTIAASVHTSAYLTDFRVKKGFSAVSFTPAFTRDNLGPYTLNVQIASGVTIIIATEDPAATAVVTCNGTVLTKGASGYPLSLPTAGDYAVVVAVTSTSGDLKRYTLTITRT